MRARKERRDVGCAGLRRHFCPKRHAAPSLKIPLAREIPLRDRHAADSRVFIYNPPTAVRKTNASDEPPFIAKAISIGMPIPSIIDELSSKLRSSNESQERLCARTSWEIDRSSLH